MRACRLILFIAAMLGGAVLVTAEVTALLSPDLKVPQPARLWALCLIFLTIETAVGIWVGEQFHRIEGVVTTFALNRVRPAPPDYGDTNNRSTGRRRPTTDAEVLDLFSQE